MIEANPNHPELSDNSSETTGKKKFSWPAWFKPNSLADKLIGQHEAKKELDKQLVFSLNTNQAKLPNWRQLRQLKHFLSPKEKLFFNLAASLGLLALVVLVINIWFFVLPAAPAYGGEYSEGLLGSPKYLNPVLAAANETDSDIAPLLFCSLLKHGDGTVEPDLAANYQISADQKEYSFTLRTDATWHDGSPVTVDDVLFTFDLIKDPDTGSPLAKTFAGVTAEKVSDRQLKFMLKEPFAPFLSTLTFGILPEKYWGEILAANVKLAELNLKPIGCGPFSFDSLKKDKNGVIKTLTLCAYSGYYNGRPYLDKATFKFYPDLISLSQALNNKNVLAASYFPKEAQDSLGQGLGGWQLDQLKLPQYTAVFFNQSRNEAIKDKAVRQALAESVDRQRLVRQVLGDQGETVNGPILPGALGYDATIKGYDFLPSDATATLDKAGWQAMTPNQVIAWQRTQEQAATPKGETFVDRPDSDRLAELGNQEYFRKKGNVLLQVKLTAVNQPESLAAAKIIAENWQAIGVKTDIETVEPEAVRRDIIQPRAYEALLYSEIIGFDPDPYPFWHSSQNGANGLNLALTNDKRIDTALDAARKTTDEKVRTSNYQKFQQIIATEIPAIFLYSPTYPYLVSNRVKGLSVEKIITPSDRLSDLTKRYLNTHRVFDFSKLF